MTTPGGSGAVLGVRVMRNSSVQAISLIVANVMQLVSILVVAAFLGPSEMARFGLLTFLAGLVTQVASLLVKPGTVRRTFGGGDDDDDDDDDDDVVSSSPPHTLGAGLAWAIVLGVIAAALIYIFRRPVADVLLGDPEDENLVALAGLLSGAMLVFKICDITLWLERRPGAFLIADTSRPLLGLVVLTAFLATGSGVEGAILGTLVGTAAAGIVGLILLSGSFEPNFDLGEIKQIILRGRYRAPIVMSFWLIQNADIFILSRFVSHDELGVYHLASRLGVVVSFLPQGFRMGMRPLAQVGDVGRLPGAVRQADRRRPAARLLLPDLHPRGARDGARRPGAGRRRAAVLRRRGRADPVHGARVRDAGALPDDQPERRGPEQAPVLHRRRRRRGALVHRRHLAAGRRDRRLRGAGRDGHRLRDPGAAALHPRPARQEAALLPLSRGADRARARRGDRRRRRSSCRRSTTGSSSGSRPRSACSGSCCSRPCTRSRPSTGSRSST